VKRPFLVLLALAASAGFAAWLVRTPHELREILTACGAWVLGFWAAAAIQSRGRRRGGSSRVEDADDEAWDDGGDDEEWDESDDDDEACEDR